MKAIVKNANKKTERPFPKLMITKTGKSPPKCIVLFTCHTKGVVIEPGTNEKNIKLGQFISDWLEEGFEDFEGSVTLSND